MPGERQREREVAALREGFLLRLELSMQEEGISATELARRVGRAPSTISDYFNPKKRALPDGETMLLLPAAVKRNLHWLATGEGDPYLTPAPGQGALFHRGALAVLRDLELMYRKLRATWDEERAEVTTSDAEGTAARLRETDAAIEQAAARKAGTKGAHRRKAQ